MEHRKSTPAKQGSTSEDDQAALDRLMAMFVDVIPPYPGVKFGGHNLTLLHGLLYIERTWPVFALQPRSKQPYPGSRGFYDATTDEATVRAMFAEHPDANIGIRTGDGLVVLDMDPRHGGEESLEAIRYEIPRGPTVITGSAGLHLYFTGDIKTRQLGRGVGDLTLKGRGGYVVAPPSVHPTGLRYAWSGTTFGMDTPALPGFLTPAEVAPLRPPVPSRMLTDGDATPYGIGAVRSEVADLRATAEGNRNTRLNEAAFNVGQIVAGGEVAEPFARSVLIDVGIEIGLEPFEVPSTVESGLRAGMRVPRCAP